MSMPKLPGGSWDTRTAWVHKHHRFAFVEMLHEGREEVIPQVPSGIVGQQYDPVYPQYIQ
jgi:hypothetical protein